MLGCFGVDQRLEHPLGQHANGVDAVPDAEPIKLFGQGRKTTLSPPPWAAPSSSSASPSVPNNGSTSIRRGHQMCFSSWSAVGATHRESRRWPYHLVDSPCSSQTPPPHGTLLTRTGRSLLGCLARRVQSNLCHCADSRGRVPLGAEVSEPEHEEKAL